MLRHVCKKLHNVIHIIILDSVMWDSQYSANYVENILWNIINPMVHCYGTVVLLVDGRSAHSEEKSWISRQMYVTNTSTWLDHMVRHLNKLCFFCM